MVFFFFCLFRIFVEKKISVWVGLHLHVFTQYQCWLGFVCADWIKCANAKVETEFVKIWTKIFINTRVTHFFFDFEVECSFVAKCVCHAIVYIYITCAFRNHGNLQDVENSLLTAANHAKPSRFRTALPQVRLFTAVWCFD